MRGKADLELENGNSDEPSRREVSAAIQVSLLKKGYPVGYIDGYLGSLTYIGGVRFLIDNGYFERSLESVHDDLEFLTALLWDALGFRIPSGIKNQGFSHYWDWRLRTRRDFTYERYPDRGEDLFTSVAGYNPRFSAVEELRWLLSKHRKSRGLDDRNRNPDWLELGWLDPNILDWSELDFELIFQDPNSTTSNTVVPYAAGELNLFRALFMQINKFIYHPVSGEPVKILDFSIAGSRSKKLRIMAKLNDLRQSRRFIRLRPKRA